MTRRPGSSIRPLASAALALAWLAATPASAGDTASGALPPGSEAAFAFDFADADLDAARDAARDDWLSIRHFHFAKKAGFGYTRRVKFGEHALSIGVRGPVMPRQKALGLNFRIRF